MGGSEDDALIFRFLGGHQNTKLWTNFTKSMFSSSMGSESEFFLASYDVNNKAEHKRTRLMLGHNT